MFNKIFNNLSLTIYVQIWADRIKATEINSGKIYDEKPFIAIKKNTKGEETITVVGSNAELLKNDSGVKVINPFSHPRTLISNFMAAQKLLQYIIHSLSKQTFLLISPLIVIHPMEKLEGGLTQIEFRAFKELALGAGSRDSVVYQGAELSIYNFDYDDIKKNEKEP